MRFPLWAGLLLLVEAPALAGASAAPEIGIEVAEAPAEDAWRVTYRFADPVAGMVFQRGRSAYRGEEWELLSEGLEWAEEHQPASGEIRDVVAVTGPPVREIALRFTSDFRTRVKAYQLTVPYTDGGRLLYTGDLSVRVAGSAGALDHRWRLRTSAGRNVVLLDHHGEGELEWLESAESTGDGTYVYFGPGRPEVRERMSFLIDPGLPAWLRREIEPLLPRLFDRYAQITGVELAFRPLVLLSYRPTDISGLTFKGGTLDGLVQMAAEGRAWEQETRDARLMWLDRSAHEAFHFWTGQMFVAAFDGAEQWITEGAADHYALATMLEMGLVDSTAHRRQLVERANECLIGLRGRPLLRSTETGDFHNLYVCGSTLWLAASTAARRSDEADEEHAFVRALLAAAERSERKLTSYRILETLHSLTGGPWAGAPLARLLFQGVPEEADELFASLMAAAGIEVELVAPEEATLHRGYRLPEEPDGSWSRLLRLR